MTPQQTRVALITGSTSGIGYAIAEAFAREGYSIVFHGLEKDAEDRVSQVRRTYNVPAILLRDNLVNANAGLHMVHEAIGAFDGIDVLVNNAGIQHVSPIESFPEEKWDQILAVNLSSAFHLSKAVWPHMKRKAFGRIINMSSAHGLRASEFKAAYVAAKHGLIGLTKVLALEGAPFGITANAICPGYVKTPLVAQQITDQAHAHHLPEEEVISKVILKKQAVKEFVSLESIANLALYLSSPSSGSVTGASFALDGGWSAQ